jgi:hypothetical protein
MCIKQAAVDGVRIAECAPKTSACEAKNMGLGIISPLHWNMEEK